MRHKASRLEVKIRNRASTASIVAAAAYCAGGRHRCDRLGRVKNYSRRRDVVSVEFVKMPHDPERVWNLACAVEKHRKARLAREILVSLPHELPLETQRVLVRGYCLWLHDRFGISSRAAIYHPLADGVDEEVVADMIPGPRGGKSRPSRARTSGGTEAGRRAEAAEADAEIDTAKTAVARAEAIEAAPHLDALDPQKAAIIWAEGRLKAEIDPESDRTLDPETETAAIPEMEQLPKFVMSKREKKRARPPHQRQRVRGGG